MAVGDRAETMPEVPEHPLWKEREPSNDDESIVWRTSMLTIRSANQPLAVRWYRNVLGFKLDYDIAIRSPQRPFRLAVLVAPDNRRIEITGRGKSKERPQDAWDTALSFTFQVHDIEKTREHLKQMGVEYHEPELEGQYGPLITLVDPDNNLVKLQFPNERAWKEHGLHDPNTAQYNPNPTYVPD
jgi:predicted enzyme related to lactoylglutathione lyase